LKKTVLTVSTAAIVTFGSTFAINSPSVYAQPSLDEVNEQQEEVKDKLSDAESKIADILFEIKDINNEIDRLEAALEQNNSEAAKNKSEVSELKEEIDDLNEKIETRNDILKDRLSSYQEGGGNIDYLEVFLGSKDFSEFVSRLSAVTSIANADAELIEDNMKDKESIEEKKEEKDEVSKELERQEETIASQKEQQKESKEKLEEKEEQVKEDIAQLENKSSELAALEEEALMEIEEQEATQVAADTTDDTEDEDEDDSNDANDDSSSNDNSGSTASSSNGDSGNDSGNSSSKKTKDKTPKNDVKTGGAATTAGNQFIGNSTYSWGSKDPQNGLFDCSGFVQWAYEQEGVNLPRSTGGQVNAGKKVSYNQAQPGDLVFFLGGSHVGIYLGGGQFIGSQSSTGVAVANMNSGYWSDNFDGTVVRVK